MDLFPEEQFYDYTKVAKRILRETLPRNYHLTFSLTEDNDAVAAQVLARGGNVAAIFRSRKAVESLLQAGSYTLAGFTAPLVDGDDSDLRFLRSGRIDHRALRQRHESATRYVRHGELALRWAANNPEAAVLDAIDIDWNRRQEDMDMPSE
jgi:hypothetical protein